MLSLKQVLKAFFHFTPLVISSQSFENLEPRIPDDMSGYDKIFERGENNSNRIHGVWLSIIDKYNIEDRTTRDNVRALIRQFDKIFFELRYFCAIAKHTQIPDEIEGEITLIYLNFYHQELYQLLNFLEEKK